LDRSRQIAVSRKDGTAAVLIANSLVATKRDLATVRGAKIEGGQRPSGTP
jgi:hypothetical protein